MKSRWKAIQYFIHWAFKYIINTAFKLFCLAVALKIINDCVVLDFKLSGSCVKILQA